MSITLLSRFSKRARSIKTGLSSSTLPTLESSSISTAGPSKIETTESPSVRPNRSPKSTKTQKPEVQKTHTPRSSIPIQFRYHAPSSPLVEVRSQTHTPNPAGPAFQPDTARKYLDRGSIDTVHGSFTSASTAQVWCTESRTSISKTQPCSSSCGTGWAGTDDGAKLLWHG
jgi:hypothetical protein